MPPKVKPVELDDLDLERGGGDTDDNAYDGDVREPSDPHPHRITDPRIVAATAVLWCAVLVVIYYLAGGTRSENGYILWNVGPSKDLFFIGVAIDTWLMWCGFNALVLIDSAINVIVLEVILTWLTLEIYDRNKIVVRWGDTIVSPECAVLVALAYNVYNSIHWLFWLYLALTQADTQLIIILANAMCTVLVVRAYMRDKRRAAAALAAVTSVAKGRSHWIASGNGGGGSCFSRCWARWTTVTQRPRAQDAQPRTSLRTEYALVQRRTEDAQHLLNAEREQATVPPPFRVVPPPNTVKR